jgi:polygalacturonase
VYDTSVANGDQELAFGSNTSASQNITVDHFRGYSKGGITILGSGFETTKLLAQNVTITGDLPSVVIGNTPGTTEINGMPESKIRKKYGLESYGQALPNATDLKGLQISDTSQTGDKAGSSISDVTFKSVCIQDIINPIDIDLTATTQPPMLSGVVFQDVHVLAPTAQFPEMRSGIPTGNPGGYYVTLVSPATTKPTQLTLDNVVIDDRASASTSISSIDAEYNTLTTTTNVYPSVLNNLEAGSTPITRHGPPSQILLNNTYTQPQTGVSNPSLAYQCPSGPMPFVSGELYVSLESKVAAGSSTNLQEVTVRAGSSITLNAVVQPVMSQTTLLRAGAAGTEAGLLSVGSPALRNPVIFYEGSRPVGFAFLSANGTLATLTVKHVSPGKHAYTAKYPTDRFYSAVAFGSVKVRAQ